MEKITLNYLYLSKQHAGGKDQVGLNLLRGLYENGVSKDYQVICYDYSLDVLKKLAPDASFLTIPSPKSGGEMVRLLALMWNNTFVVRKLIKKTKSPLVYHLSCNNGFLKMPCISVEIPHDIKAISHRVLGSVKIVWYKYLFYRMMYALDFHLADYIIAISDTDKKEIQQYYPQYSAKVKRIYNPIITKSAQRDPSNTQKYVCALNLQFHHKNIITLIRAFELLKGKTDCRLLLMGKVPPRVQYLKDYVQEHHLDDVVQFTGFVTDDVAEKVMVNSQLYVNPSLNEGFGMTAVEAMMLRVPTLLSDIPTNREVTQNLCSYYQPLQDPQALADAILDCLQHRPTEEELEHNRQVMIKEYDYHVIAKKYDEFFRQILKENQQ